MSATDLDRHPWRISEDQFPADGTFEEKARFLLRYAILAPSSHNSEPWQFRVRDGAIDILVDESRWLQVADPDRRELLISIGCALENLLVAAEHFGWNSYVDYFPEADPDAPVVIVRLSKGGSASDVRPPGLFAAITERRTSHETYEQRQVPEEILDRMRSLCLETGLSVYLTGDPEIKRAVDELVVRGDAIQFANPQWRRELGEWVGRGAFGQSWLMAKIGQMAVTYLNLGESTGQTDSKLLMSAPVLAVIGAEQVDRTTRIQVGQVYERIALLGASAGISCHPMSQVLEVPELKAEVADLLPDEGVVPEHAFRLGYPSEEEDHTPRRPLDAVLLS
jgi:nitroreductase